MAQGLSRLARRLGVRRIHSGRCRRELLSCKPVSGLTLPLLREG